MRYSESQVTSELLDQPIFPGEPRKLFICSTPRSGSYLLCRYMINAGIGVPHEYFNPIIMRQIAERLGLGMAVRRLQWRPRNLLDRLHLSRLARGAEEAFLADYLAALVSRRCQNGVFAAKIHFDHYLKVLDNPTGQRLLDGGRFVHLYRKDLVRQAVSTHFANLTGRWSIDDTLSTPPAANADFFDAATLDQTLQDLAREDMGWRVFLARNDPAPLSISYEELCADPPGVVAEIARRLGLPAGRLRTGYSELGAAADEQAPELPRRADVARHYLQTFRSVRPPPGPMIRPNGDD